MCGEWQYDLCSDETWMFNKPGKSLVYPMKGYLPDWTATDATHSCMPGCEIILAVNSKLVDLCVWILFMWYQKMKASCLVVFRDEETFETAAAMLSRESRTNSLIWEVLWFYPLDIFWRSVTKRVCVCVYIYIQPFGILLSERHWNWTCFDTCCLLGLCAA